MSLISELGTFKREMREMNGKLDRVVELLEQVVELLEDHQEPPPTYTYTVPGWTGGENSDFPIE